MFKVFIIVPYGQDKEKAAWKEAGVGFANKDGSINVSLYLFPDVKFQLRKEEVKNGK